jgi:hypothetical protein
VYAWGGREEKVVKNLAAETEGTDHLANQALTQLVKNSPSFMKHCM